MVPIEEVVEVRNQKKTVSNRKLWPGYVFNDMALPDESGRSIEQPWEIIKEKKGVKGVGGGETPTTTREEEGEASKNKS